MLQAQHSATLPAQQQQQQTRSMQMSLDGLAWHRPKPQLLQPPASEWKWLPAGACMGLLLDSTMSIQDSHAQVVVDLVRKALTAPLLPSQQQLVLAHLDADPQLVHTLQLQPQQLPALVENTPMLAYQLLLRMQGSRRIAAYHQVLATMPLSLHSMEVVNKLAAPGHLPHAVVQLYISNCINACDDIPDKFMQNRLVRLVCVFLQSLIRHRVVNIADLLLEVQAFCVRFSRIREAATLFRALKQMEQGVSTSSSPVAAGSSAAGQGSPVRQEHWH